MAEPVYIEAASQFSAGSGTQEDPYQISSAQELAYFSELMNNSETAKEYRKAHYMLVADIALNEGDANTWSNEGPQYSWNPIGVRYYDFEGVFDGVGHTVSGLYINVDCHKNETGDSYGLFGNNDGTIKNVNVANSYICVSGFPKEIGAIAGENGTTGVVSNCTSSAIIECYDATCGGVIGSNRGVVENSVFAGTINELRNYSFNALGGVAGASCGKVLNCTNEGQINSGIVATESAGGIVGRLSDGTVNGCTNNGIVNCNNGEVPEDENRDVSGAQVGGIVGLAFSSTIGGEKYANKDILIANCVNNGEVLGGKAAAGIVSEANNNGSNYSVRIIDCTNNGKVADAGRSAGIVVTATCTGAELTVSGCRNTADITDQQGGGIVCNLTPGKGTVKVLNCTNSGNISAQHLYAGGVISRVYLFGHMDSNTLIEGCSNTGKITTPITAGGIIGDVNGSGVLTNSSNATFKINKCTNTGEVYTQSSNAFIGGIVGGFGAKGISSEITNCVNRGTLTVEDVAPSAETISNDKKLELARMCGGIVGRIGDTLYLSTSGDRSNASNVNAEEALFKISDCYSNGIFNVPAEDKYKNHEGKNIWDNHLGGIVGNCSAADGYSFRVENCGYTNIDRGLGTKGYPDVGTQMSPEEIEAIMNRL